MNAPLVEQGVPEGTMESHGSPHALPSLFVYITYGEGKMLPLGLGTERRYFYGIEKNTPILRVSKNSLSFGAKFQFQKRLSA